MRAAILCDIPGVVAKALIDAAFVAAERRADFTVVAFVTSNDKVRRPTSIGVRLGRNARRALSVATRRRLGGPQAFDIVSCFDRHDVPAFVADSSVNDPAFLDEIVRRTNPDLLLNIDGLEILKQSTLDRFADAVNYHDGHLPARAGRSATSQSIYLGDRTSGFTFHRMTSGIDAGPVLLQGSVSTEGDVLDVLHRKVGAAAGMFGEVLDAIASGEDGTVQAGEGTYHSTDEHRNLTVIDDPSAFSGEELLRRDRAFAALSMPVDGTIERVTSISPSTAEAAHAFQASDGRWLRPTSIDYLPTWYVLAARRVRRLLPG